MGESARVSVIMPVRNAEAYVEAAIRSALASDLHELEVVVVDDGSTDTSAAIVADIGDPRVVMVRLRSSGGPSRPRNVGIARATAPYLAFLDADDLLKPHKLSSAVNALDRHPEAGFAFANFEDIDANGRVLRASVIAHYPRFQALTYSAVEDGWRLIPQAELAHGLLYENFMATSGVVVRKHLLTELGPFDESSIYSEDLDLWFRLAHRSAALYCDRIGHSYREHPGSLTCKKSARSLQDRIDVLRREKSRWSDRAALRQLDRRIAANIAGIGYEERGRGRTRSTAMFVYAFLISREMRWLRAMVGSAFSQSARSRQR